MTKSTDDTPKGELSLYQTEGGRTRFEGETAWLPGRVSDREQGGADRIASPADGFGEGRLLSQARGAA